MTRWDSCHNISCARCIPILIPLKSLSVYYVIIPHGTAVHSNYNIMRVPLNAYYAKYALKCVYYVILRFYVVLSNSCTDSIYCGRTVGVDRGRLSGRTVAV